MRVLTLHGAGDMRLEERPVPSAGAGQMVVKIEYAGICGTDVEFFHGLLPPFMKYPILPGHENVGVVTETGDGVKGFEPGDRLICGPPGFCREMCPSCREGKANICRNAFPGRTAGFGVLDGGYAEYLLINDAEHTSLVKIPDNVDMKDAVLFDVICVAVHAIKGSRFKIGDNVVVSGAGSIGLSVVQFLKAGGANKVIVLDIVDESEQIVKQYGGDFLINTAGCEDVAGAVKELLGSDTGADIVFECAGAPESFTNCVSCVKPGGQLVCVGTILKPVTFVPAAFHPGEPDFHYSFVYTEADIKTYMDLLAAGKVSFPGMVTGVFSMENVVEEYFGAKDRKGHIKALISPNL
ncbi:MAG: zinc-binding dehydrogenase [Clostridiales bacterium]|nr:zinc-binding dehydrogenase [Clostridiales bacterium]